MSFTADVSFLLPEENNVKVCTFGLYQCPLQRTSHFYNEDIKEMLLADGVSMSFTADVSFLQDYIAKKDGTGDLYQCPLQRTSHFYLSF